MRGQLGRQSNGAALGTTDGGRRRGERRSVRGQLSSMQTEARLLATTDGGRRVEGSAVACVGS